MCGILVILEKIDTFSKNLNRIKHRGPDDTRILKISDSIMFGFQRLSINDITDAGMQPFQHDNVTLMCNGEIYNHKKFKFNNKSNSDCEVLIHLWKKYGELMTEYLDGVYALVLHENDKLYIARDPFGIRPLYIGFNSTIPVAFSSEIKAIDDIPSIQSIYHFPIGSYGIYDLNKKQFQIHKTKTLENINTIYKSNMIECILINAVKKRLMTDRPVGFFLSGGLDSSIIASIGSKFLKKQIDTFSIGLKGSSSPDLKYARIVANYLNTNHHEYTFTVEEGINAIKDVIYHLETYDCTTIRASIPMYLLCKKIKDFKNIVLMSGEGADELFAGYLYMKNAPKDKIYEECENLLNQVHEYDALRADRCTAAFGKELRVPFFDKYLVQYIRSINSSYRDPCKNNIEKFILRKAFIDYLPIEITCRQKNAFSDAVGYDWIEKLKEYIECLDVDCSKQYSYNPPKSKEEYFYRNIYFSLFNHDNHINGTWRPKWTTIIDPSATFLHQHKK